MSNKINEILENLMVLKESIYPAKTYADKMESKNNSKLAITFVTLITAITAGLLTFRGFPDISHGFGTFVMNIVQGILCLGSGVSIVAFIGENPKKQFKQALFNEEDPVGKTSYQLNQAIWSVIQGLEKEVFIECAKEVYKEPKYKALQDYFENEFENRVNTEKERVEKLKKLEENISLYNNESVPDEEVQEMIKTAEKSVSSVSIISN